MGLHYTEEHGLDPECFRGVRCLFLDLHLLDSTLSSDEKRHFGLLASILESVISENGGPYVLVLWSEYAEQADQLREYLEAAKGVSPHVRPLAVLRLEKKKFINIETGNVNAPEELRKQIVESLTSCPQLAALLSWEQSVQAAAGDTLASLLKLVPDGERKIGSFGAALDIILSRLARESVGRPNVAVDPRSAVYGALAPILSDRTLHQKASEENTSLWCDAITRHSDSKLPPASANEAGAINRMLHMSLGTAETLRPTDWGAVVDWPFTWDDEELQKRTDWKINELLGGQFCVESKDRSRCQPVLVRIGAACDYAQNRKGPLTYLVGFQVPLNADRKKYNDGRLIPITEAIWNSPAFVEPGSEEVFRLEIHVRFPIVVLPSEAKDWQVKYRIREQLLMQLVGKSSAYVSRPGIIQLPT